MTLSVQKVREQDAVIDFKATLASAEYEQELDTWLTKKSQTARIDGFRPGKAPLTVIKKLYGDEASRSVVNSIVDKVLHTIDKEHQIRVAGQPSVTVKKADTTEGFECSISIECLPTIELKNFGTIACEELVIDISKKEVDDAVDQLFKRYQGHQKEAKKTAADWGDKITFVLQEKGKKGDDKEQDIIIEEKIKEDKTWQALHDGLHGKKDGDTTEVTIAYPKNFSEKSIAGKSFTYEIQIKAVYAAMKFKLDETFAKEFDCDTLPALHDKMKSTMENDQKHLISLYHKRQILDALSDQYKMALPKSAVDVEFDKIWNRLQTEIAAARARGEKEDINLKEIELEYREIAERRVKLGLLVSEIAKVHSIALSKEEIQRELVNEAMKYRDQFNEVVDHFIKNPRHLEKLVAPALEDKVVEFVFSKAKKKSTKITVKDLPAKLKGIVPGYEGDENQLEDKKAASKPDDKKALKEGTSESEKAPAKKASTKKGK